MANVKTSDIKHQGELVVVKIPNTKTKISRMFTIEAEFAKVIEEYESLRPQNANTDRFFLDYRNGKCTKQVIGKNKFGTMPKLIAEFLGLEDPHLYTGHSFRRTSATLLANSGADLLTLKRHGGWKSSSVAEGYIEESIYQKRKTGNLITSAISVNRQASSTGSTSTVTSATNSTATVTSAIATSSTVTSGRASTSTVISETASTSRASPMIVEDPLLQLNQVYATSTSNDTNITLPKEMGIILNNCSNFTINYH